MLLFWIFWGLFSTSALRFVYKSFKAIPRHDLHPVSPLQRGCEYSKVIAVHGPNILLWTIQNSVYPNLLCLSAATPRMCNGRQRLNIRGWYKPTGEGPTPCSTASERSSSRAIWGKALQLNLFSLARRRLRADLNLAFKIFKGEVDLNPPEFFPRLPRADLRGHAYQLLQGSSRLRSRRSAFSVRFMKYWNRLSAHLVLSPSVSTFKKQLDRQWSEIFPATSV